MYIKQLVLTLAIILPKFIIKIKIYQLYLRLYLEVQAYLNFNH